MHKYFDYKILEFFILFHIKLLQKIINIDVNIDSL